MKKILKLKPAYQALLLLLAFDISIIGFRIAYVESMVFAFLIWNLFLAIVPLGFIWLGEKFEQKKMKMGLWATLALAVLFLPNSPYIVTDLFHLRWTGSAPIWYDTLLIFSFAITGLIIFYISLIKMERIFKRQIKSVFQPILIPFIIFMSSFGVYLGRFVRFNSWDIITQPTTLLYEMTDRFLHPFGHPETWSVTIAYGAFFLVGYYFVRQLRFQPIVENSRNKGDLG